MEQGLLTEQIWTERQRYDDEEKVYYRYLQQHSIDGRGHAGASGTSHVVNGQCSRTAAVELAGHGDQDSVGCSLKQQIRQVRQHVSNSLAAGKQKFGSAPINMKTESLDSEVTRRLNELEKNYEYLLSAVKRIEVSVDVLRKEVLSPTGGGTGASVRQRKADVGAKVEPADDDDDMASCSDEDVDLFGSDEDEEAERRNLERVKEYQAKKAKKPALVAKSNISLDVKPWDDETDMAEIEKMVRSVETDGLKWGAAKLVPLAYGIRKLQISCVVEDEKVGTDFLEEQITAFEDLVQSVDVAAFNKV